MALAIAGVIVAAIVAAGGGSATAADPPGLSLKPDVIHPAGVGRFDGSISHIPHGNRRPERAAARAAGAGRRAAGSRDERRGRADHDDDGALAPATSSASSASTTRTGAPAGRPTRTATSARTTTCRPSTRRSASSTRRPGHRVAATTFDGLFSAGATGTPCDNSNQGDPVALYDPFGDRCIVTDFAWNDAQFSTGPFYECLAVSKTGDPVDGGWYFYAWQTDTGATLPDYPKLGVWPDGIYMSANVFASSGSGSFQNAQVWAFDRHRDGERQPGGEGRDVRRAEDRRRRQRVQPAAEQRARGHRRAAGGLAELLRLGLRARTRSATWKFHVDWTTPANSTFTGPTNTTVATFNVGPSDVPEKDGNDLDTLSYRLMMQNQYTNIGGRESLWLTHTVGSGGTPNLARIRWYELPVTGGAIGPLRQQSTYAPADSRNRFMPSLAVDKNGDMAVGYSVSDSSMYPAIRYTGRPAGEHAVDADAGRDDARPGRAASSAARSRTAA